ncbi:hypothetical protein [Nocardioides lijunqiniae]|uniref:hypothetical protein n=1 Tax=Nocardioides lijunqiniae TaxID=2760832 RepID=UPI001878FA82|nr:hypothetical protein [Nocardioides lijunqiniae]
MTDEIVDATPEQVVAVVEQMRSLPWPEGDEWLEWEIDGLEGQTSYLMHVLPLAATEDASALEAFVARLTTAADKRWVARYRFDAMRFTDDADTDPAAYDHRSAPAALVRSLGAETAPWWPLGQDAAVLVDGSDAPERQVKAAVLVLPSRWLKGPPVAEVTASSPLVEDFLSADTGRVMHAVWEVFATRDPAVLGPLEKSVVTIDRATEDLDLGGMLASNGTHLAHALHRIRLFGKKQCLCAAYPSHQFYDVEKEVARQHVRVVGTVPNDRQWVPDRICECLACGRRFQVEQGEYHYPWWDWTDLGPGM